jgi:ketosteroid isomerase-like protein
MAKKRPAKSTRPAARRKKATGKPARVRARTAKPTPRKRAARRPSARTAAPAAVANPLRELAQQLVGLTVTHEDEKAFAFYADNVESSEAGMPAAVGIEAIRQKFAMWRGMVSDSTWQARNVWVDGSAIIIEWSGRVTFAATGKQVDFNEVAIHEVENGKIVRERFYYDPSVLQP